jgi:hypothetical protein
MCPACLETAGLVVASVVSSGGLTALVKKFFVRRRVRKALRKKRSNEDGNRNRT